MALDEKKKYRADGTAIDEKGDRSVVEDVAVEEQGGLSVPKMGIPPTREQQARPVVQPQVVQAPSVENTAVQPTQVVAQPQPVKVAPVETAPQRRSSEDYKNPDGTPIPAEVGELTTTVQPIEPGAPSEVEGTPIVDTKTQWKPYATVQSPWQNGTSVDNLQLDPSKGVAPPSAPTAQNEGQQGTTASTTATAPLFKSNPALQKQYEAEVNSWNLNGNVDMYNRPMVSADKMRAAGYDVPDGETSTIYTMSWSIGNPVKNGKYKSGDGKSYAHNLVMTPILANGDVWSQEQLAGYWDKLIKKAGGNPQKALELDKQLAKVIVGIDTPEGIEQKIHDAHEKYYLGGSQPQNGKNTTNANVSAGSTVQGPTDNASAVEAATRKAMEEYNDLFLAKVIQSNSGKDSPNAKLVVKIANDILKSRGKQLPPEATVSVQGANGASADGAKKPEVADNKGDEKEEDELSEKDLEVGIDTIKERLKDESLTAEAKKEYEKRLAEWEKELEDKKNNKKPELSELDYWKETYKDSDDKTLEIIRKALDGLPGEETKIRAIDETLAARHPERQPEPEMKLEDMDNYNKAVADAKKAQDELDAAMKNKGSYISVARDELEKRLGEAGLTKEDEKRLEKRHRTQRIIANIGDILQGFANLAGTWYGANSMKLTSMSGAVGESQKEVRAEREKRREKLEKNYQDLLAQLKKDGDTDIAQRVAALKAANDRVNKIADNFYTEQHKSRNRKKEQDYATVQHGVRQEKTTEETNKRVAYKAEKQQETDNNKSKNRQSEIAAASAGRVHEKRVAGEEARKTKRTPSYNDTHGGKGSKKGKSGGKRKSKGTVHG